MAHLSVVVPVYKAENCLRELYTRLTITLGDISPDYEIILVEDCGGDSSWSIIEELARNDSKVKGLQFSRNFGQHYGITAGIEKSDGDWLVVMDCDLQDRPEEIKRLYEKAKEGFDVVLAKRGKRKDPLLKRLSSRLFYSLFNYLADMTYDAEVGNFRIVSRRVAHNYRQLSEQLRFFAAMIDWMGFPTSSIDVQHDERFDGKSTYTISKLLKLATNTIVAFSDKPLRISIKFGFFMSAFSFLYGGYILVHSLLYGSAVVGWSSLIISLYFIGGIIIANLGVIGIYLGKSFDETKKRPLYIIAKETIHGK